MDCSPPGSAVHGISQARILEYYLTIKRNEIESFVVMGLILESVMQSEVKWERENKYSRLMWNIKKHGTDEHIFRVEIEKQT